MKFGEKMSVIRGYIGESQGEIARRMKISPSYLSQLENGSRRWNIETFERAALALELLPLELSFLVWGWAWFNDEVMVTTIKEQHEQE